MILGLDIGKKRTGVAVANECTGIATPHGSIQVNNRQELLNQIKDLVQDFKAVKIVVGLPKTLKGEIGPAAQEMLTLVEWMKPQVPVQWVFWDERLSTKEADRVLTEALVPEKKKRGVLDQLAAQRILQTYLDYQRNISGLHNHEDSPS